MPIYGQVVVGPPGSGKTTYCNGMQQYLRLIGRETLVVNLDPANEYHAPKNSHGTNNSKNEADSSTSSSSISSATATATAAATHLPYDTLLDTSEDVINLSTVMEELQLGPNGGLLYCLEYIHHHIDTFSSMIRDKLDSFATNRNNHHHNNHNDSSNEPSPSRPPYLLFDLPGQIELYTHTNTVQSILEHLIKTFDMRLTMVQLIDSHYCCDVYKFISSSVLSVSTMLRLELPAVNVLSKVDLLSTYAGTSTAAGSGDNGNSGNGHGSGVGRGAAGSGAAGSGNLEEYDGSECDIGMPFNLDFFMECHELDRLIPYLDVNLNLNLHPSNFENDHIQDILDNDVEYQTFKHKRIQNSQRRNAKYTKLHRELCDVVNDFSLLCFVPLNINDAASVGRVLTKIDKSNGYVFTMTSGNSGTTRGRANAATATATNSNGNTVEDMFKCAMQADKEWGYEQIADIQERYMDLYQDVVPELKNSNTKNY